MIIYNYDKNTHYYTSQDYADPDPMSPGNYLIPAYSTTITIPDVNHTEYKLKFNIEKNEWEKIKIIYEYLIDKSLFYYKLLTKKLISEKIAYDFVKGNFPKKFINEVNKIVNENNAHHLYLFELITAPKISSKEPITRYSFMNYLNINEEEWELIFKD